MIRIGFTKYFSLLRKPKWCFSSFSDPYYILGVDKNAAFPEIKKAFYKLANEFHPDKNNSQVRYTTFCSKLNKNSLSSSKPLKWSKCRKDSWSLRISIGQRKGNPWGPILKSIQLRMRRMPRILQITLFFLKKQGLHKIIWLLGTHSKQ